MDSTANKTEYRSKRNPTGKPQILSMTDLVFPDYFGL